MSDGQAISPQELREVQGALAQRAGVEALPGLRGGPLTQADNLPVYFAVRCGCGTAAVLSVEVAPDKTAQEVWDAAPALTERLAAQVDAFRRMPCSMHQKMRMVRRSAGGQSQEATDGET